MLINQISPTTSGQACLAMLTGKSLLEVVNATGVDQLTINSIIKYLIENKLYPINVKQIVEELSQYPFFGNYLCRVPSLNIVGKAHYIIVQIVDTETDSSFIVYDPNYLLEGKNWYFKDAVSMGEVVLMDCYFINDDVLR